MLRELHVRSLGIVDDLTVVLGPGLSAITGETGAGKTLLIEAVDLLLGGRADPSLVREGDTEARVEGRFELPDGTEVVLARVVPMDGRSRASIDGRLATSRELAEVGARLVDLHGQHAHQTLLAPGPQREALDQYAGDAARSARAELLAAADERRRVTRELESMGGDERARAREVDLLRFQVEEIGAAGLGDPDEDAVLGAEEQLLGDAAAHRDAATSAFSALEGPASDAVGAAVSELSGRPSFDAIVERLRAAQAELADLEHELRVVVERAADDPARVEQVRTRRQLLRELRRKYGETLTEVMVFARDAAQRLAVLEQVETRAGELEAELAGLDTRTQRAASALSAARRAAAGPLAAEVTKHLHELAMPAARATIAVEAGPLTEEGADEVTFLLSPNPGEPPKPLARAASGGELSRVMLALRLVLSDAPPTLVFDEVDAGIGGEAGVAVGRLLGSLGVTHQVLCVTHLAQVAAFAGTQVAVEKVTRRGRTVVGATAVEGEARVAELSRMLAGVGESEHARSHASELLDRARAGTV
jgi:DNA repair protein RecN (Recombination protein N)